MSENTKNGYIYYMIITFVLNVLPSSCLNFIAKTIYVLGKMLEKFMYLSNFMLKCLIILHIDGMAFISFNL